MEDYIEQIPMRDFSQLKDLVYEIPSQQRGYKWTPSNIKELVGDLWEFINAPKEKRVYCLQPLAVVPIIKDRKYSVLDGQQRLTTLFKHLNFPSRIVQMYTVEECALYK